MAKRLILMVLCLFAQLAAADESPEQQLRRRMEEIQSQLEQIRSQYGDLVPAYPATPRDKVKLAVDAINRNYSGLKQIIYAGRLPADKSIPVPRATRLSGFVEVHGIDTEPVRHGWSTLDLRYTVREDFVGYLVTTRYYDTRAKKFTEQKDYLLATISTDIRVISLGGRQCVKPRSDFCVEWANFAKWEPTGGDVYPAVHDWVINGSSEGGVVSLRIEVPDIYFSSLDKRAGRALGCSGTGLKMPLKEFADQVASQTLSKTLPADQPGDYSNCDFGSTIDIHVDFCDTAQYADFNACRQVEILLGSMKQSLALRDAFKELGDTAEDVDHLNRLVSQKISKDYPLIDLSDDEFLKNYSAKNECGVVTIPDLCKGCMPKPLCQWERNALQAHEDNHEQFLASRADYRKLWCGTMEEQVALYPDANERSRAEARLLSELEIAAYTEQARYLNDTIQEQLHGIFDCSLSPGFLPDYSAVQQELGPH